MKKNLKQSIGGEEVREGCVLAVTGGQPVGEKRRGYGRSIANRVIICYKFLNDKKKQKQTGNEACETEHRREFRQMSIGSKFKAAIAGIAGLGVAFAATPANAAPEDSGTGSQFKTASMNLSEIDVPFRDVRANNFPLNKIQGLAEIASARANSIVLLYQDANHLPEDQDNDLKEIKDAARRLIGEGLPFFKVMATTADEPHSSLKVYVRGVEVCTYQKLHSGHGGLTRVVAETAAELYHESFEIDRELELKRQAEQEAKPSVPVAMID